MECREAAAVVAVMTMLLRPSLMLESPQATWRVWVWFWRFFSLCSNTQIILSFTRHISSCAIGDIRHVSVRPLPLGVQLRCKFSTRSFLGRSGCRLSFMRSFELCFSHLKTRTVAHRLHPHTETVVHPRVVRRSSLARRRRRRRRRSQQPRHSAFSEQSPRPPLPVVHGRSVIFRCNYMVFRPAETAG